MDTMHRYHASVAWEGTTAVGYDRYDRAHRGATDPPTIALGLSGDPSFGGDATRLNPEQLIVLAAASCQLLSFLAVAARARIDVRAYTDEAHAEMPGDDRPVRLTHITLEPHLTLAPAPGGPAPTEARVRHLVEVAHRECYVANSLRSKITINPTIVFLNDEPNSSSDL